MKVLNLRCAHDHGFEGWFASEDDYLAQAGRGIVACPLCGDTAITRLPSAPRLNVSRQRAAAEPAQASAETPSQGSSHAMAQSHWMRAMRKMLDSTEDVGERFPEEARRIHYGETEHRGIRGQASAQERAELAEEGIEVMPLPLPAALKGSAH